MTISPTVRRLILIAALALVPIVPYALLGYTGQDLPFHVCSWLDLKEGWLAGNLTPGWSAAANYGLGDPHLTFYPPVSYFLGALITLILPLRLAPAAFAWLALVLSGASMYAASKSFVAGEDRIKAALVYMLGPYMITTSLVRFAAAELLVQAWLPLVAMYFYKAVGAVNVKDNAPDRRRSLIVLALLLGLSWITNIPASIVLLYSLAIAALICACLQQSAMPLLRIVLAETLAGAIAAFHLVPVWKERPWIHPDTLLRIDPLQLLLFMPHYNFNDSPLLVACWIFLCIEMLLVVACLRGRSLPISADPSVPIWATLAASSFLLQSPIAIPLWQYAPELRFIQFPLRFLAIIGVALPLLLFDRGTRTSLRRPAYIVLGMLSVMPFLAYLSEQAVASNRTPPLPSLLASWQRKGAPEYLPAGTLTPLGPPNMPVVSALDPSNPGTEDRMCHVELGRQSPNLRIVRTVSPAGCHLRFALYFYPYWRASDDLQESISISRDSMGLLLLDVPAGSRTVSLAFRPASPIRTASRLISVLAFVLAVLALFLLRRRPDLRSTGSGGLQTPDRA